MLGDLQSIAAEQLDHLTQLDLCSAVLQLLLRHSHLQTDTLFLDDECNVELVVRHKRFKVVLMDQVGTQAVCLLLQQIVAGCWCR